MERELGVRLDEVVQTSLRLRSEPGRRAKIDLLASLLRSAAPDEIEAAVAYLTGRLPQGKLGIGAAALRDACPHAVAPSPTLTLREVDAAFRAVSDLKGTGSSSEKIRVLRELQSRATAGEQQFLNRLLFGELRQGALEGLMAEAVARAAGIPAKDVRRAVMADGDLTSVAKAALTEGAEALGRLAIRLFRPVQPMLACAADDVGDAVGRLEEAILEFKLDGARIQIHKAGDEIKVFSRMLREVTPAVPEIVEAARALPVREMILDGEVLALRGDGRPHPFQTTMSRFGRKIDVEGTRATVPLTPVLFDLLYLDGADLTVEPLSVRAGLLGDRLPASLIVPRIVTSKPGEAAAFLEEALRRGHEGIMAKAPGALYEAGRRGRSWLKVKSAHTLDLVVLAVEWGSGRGRGKLSNIHLGARDPASGGFVMLGKTFKGMTDEILAWQTKTFLEMAIARDDWTVHVRPEVVVEIAFNDVQASPHYPGGLALRFARVKRYRPDKTPDQADTIAAVREIYRRATGQDPPAPRS